MKVSSLILIAASFCVPLSAGAREADVAQGQQQNCGKVKIAAKPRPSRGALVGENATRDTHSVGKSSSTGEKPVDLVICLDTSNSMDGLIGSAKEKIWDIVNELATAKPKPHLRVGLYAYGTPSFGAQTGFVHKVVDLSDDLDKVFTELTALRTYGGDEYCARVISTATDRQSWSDAKSLKILVVAGNESATQDPNLNVFETAKRAITRGIIINTIYCGSPTNPEASAWREIASSADGQFAAIDQAAGTVVISTPFDQKLAELSGAINSTYVAYGKSGYEGQQKQSAADSLSRQMGASNFASRAMAKASGQYRNSSWDLLDASGEKGFDLSKIKNEDLPPEMQRMSPEQQTNYINEKMRKRAAIQKQIADLNTQRAKYIQDERSKSNKGTDKAFDTAMLNALRQQAKQRGFTFDAK
ncbi:MAG: VWA domain-containing protein [Candidatus Obscuribacterales bacterium]|nr:VWA domain-containing protein [Candidatus Obscuribacterales bacterium]